MKPASPKKAPVAKVPERVQSELRALQETALHFETTIVLDSVQRLRYRELVLELRNTILRDLKKGVISAEKAAQVSFDTRNAIRVAQQGRVSEFGFQISQMLEQERTFAELLERRAQAVFQRSFRSLSGFQERSRVYIELIRGNLPNARITRGIVVSGALSLGLIVLTGAHVFEAVVKSDHKVQTALREITLLSYTWVGGAIGQRVGAAACLASAGTGPAAPWVYAGCTVATSALGGMLGRAVGEVAIWASGGF